MCHVGMLSVQLKCTENRNAACSLVLGNTFDVFLLLSIMEGFDTRCLVRNQRVDVFEMQLLELEKMLIRGKSASRLRPHKLSPFAPARCFSLSGGNA